MSAPEKSNVVNIATREVDPLDAWLVKARDGARKVAKAVDAASKVGHALADLAEKIRGK
jgi:hypothetical protein